MSKMSWNTSVSVFIFPKWRICLQVSKKLTYTMVLHHLVYVNHKSAGILVSERINGAVASLNTVCTPCIAKSVPLEECFMALISILNKIQEIQCCTYVVLMQSFSPSEQYGDWLKMISKNISFLMGLKVPCLQVLSVQCSSCFNIENIWIAGGGWVGGMLSSWIQFTQTSLLLKFQLK